MKNGLSILHCFSSSGSAQGQFPRSDKRAAPVKPVCTRQVRGTATRNATPLTTAMNARVSLSVASGLHDHHRSAGPFSDAKKMVLMR